MIMWKPWRSKPKRFAPGGKEYVEKLIKSWRTDPEDIFYVEKLGIKVPYLQWPVHQELYWTFIKRATYRAHYMSWHFFQVWHILSSYNYILYILLFSEGTSYGIHIFMYAVKCISTHVRYLIYISIYILRISLVIFFISQHLRSNIKVFTCHNI